jgi:hypothetical protein
MIVYSYHRSLPSDITLLRLPNLAKIEPIDFIISRRSCYDFSQVGIGKKDLDPKSKLFSRN